MRRPIAETRLYVTRRLKNVSEISMRKQVCLAYLDWGVRKDKKSLRQFVEIAVEWRKKEDKIGYHRTKLERMARRLFSEVKTIKRSERFTENSKQIGKRNAELGRGWLSPEKQKDGAEKVARARKIGDANGTRTPGRWWIVYPPDGEPFKVRGLNKLCEEHGLSATELSKTAVNPAKGRHHKGWRAEHWDPLWDKVHGEDNRT
jgi:hypothetical protein